MSDPQPPTPLDAFFARCEDVLTDWQGSGDAMHSDSGRTARTCVEMHPVGEPWHDHVQIQGGAVYLGTQAEVDAALLSLLRWSDLSYRDESHIERGRE